MLKNIIIIIALAGVSGWSYYHGVRNGRATEYERARKHWTEYYYRQIKIDRRTCELRRDNP